MSRALLAASAAVALGAGVPERWAGAQSLPIYGGLTLDAGYFDASTRQWKSVNESGLATGIVKKGVGGSSGDRATRFGASGPAQELGNLGVDGNGITQAYAYSINSSGQVAGEATKFVGTSNRGQRPVRWDANGTPVELALLGTSATSTTAGRAYAVNDSGQTAGSIEKWEVNAVKGTRAVRWDPAGNALELQTLWTDSSGFGYSNSFAMNAAGVAVGVTAKYAGAAYKGDRPIRWDAAGAALEMQVLGTSPTDVVDTATAYAVNDAGQSTGVASEYIGGVNRGNRAVRWSAGGAIEKLGTINPSNPNDDYSDGVNINSSGEVVGYAAKWVAGGLDRGVRWDAQTGAALELEPLAGFQHCGAHGINDAGQMVGGSYTFVGGNPVQRAAYWERDGAITNLNTLLSAEDAARWNLRWSESISNNGWVSGWGDFDPDGAAGPQQSSLRHFVMRPTSVWLPNGGGSWDAAGNWSNGAAPGAASSLVFNRGAGVAAYTVALTPASRARQVMVANDRVTLDLAGGALDLIGRLAVAPTRGDVGELTIANGAITAALVNVGGAYGGGPGLPGGAGVLNVPAGARLNVAGRLSVFDTAGTAVNLSGGTISVGTLRTWGNPTRFNWTLGTLELTSELLILAPAEPLGAAVTLSPGKTLRMKEGTGPVVVSAGGSLQLTGGTLDLTDNALITDAAGAGTAAGSTYDGVQGLVQSGFNGGGWDGAGIVTSRPEASTSLTTIGVATGAQVLGLGPADVGYFRGFEVGATTVIAAYTYAGDANLDGQINADDYANIDFNAPTPGAAGYYNGDFNYDGGINADDYALIDFNNTAQGDPFPAAAATIGSAAVPEPAAATGVLIAMLAVTRGARRHSFSSRSQG